MADVDSLYPQPVNPLTNLQNVAGISTAVTHNKLMQQELQGQTGLANLYATAPRDASGNIDQNALMQRSPEAGIMAPEVYHSAQAAKALNLQIQQQQFANQKLKLSMTAAALMPLANNPNATPDDYVRSTNDVIQASGGLTTPADFASNYQALANTLAQGGNTQVHAQQLLAQQLAMGADPEAGMKILYGSPVNAHVGGGTVSGTQSPITGALSGATYTADTLPPTILEKDANPKSPTFGQTTYRGASPAPVIQTIGPNGASTSGKSPLAGAFTTPAAAAAGGAAASSSSTQPVADKPVAALSPGTENMLGDAGTAAQTRVDDTIKTAAQSRVSQDVNQQIVNLAGNLKDNVGPTKTGWTTLIGKVADIPVLGEGMKVVIDKDPADTAGQLQELQKYLLRSAQMRGQQLGLGGTDYQASLAQHANPNDAQFPQTIQKLAKYNLALDMAEQGRANALDQYPGAKKSPEANQEFENKMRNATNIDVYRAMIASPAERQEMYATMTPEQKTQMITDRRKLLALGAIPAQLQASSIVPAQPTTDAQAPGP